MRSPCLLWAVCSLLPLIKLVTPVKLGAYADIPLHSVVWQTNPWKRAHELALQKRKACERVGSHQSARDTGQGYKVIHPSKALW